MDTKLKVKILIVDDLKDNLFALEALLRHDDVEIFKVDSGVDALEVMVLHEFALALIDVHMPNMSGLELAELMRGIDNTKNIPIIFLTATAKDQVFSFNGYETGAVDFLIKPLDTHALKCKVNIFITLFSHKKEQEELLAELKKTKVELELAIQMRDEFLTIATHELKTPITSLKLQLEMTQRLIHIEKNQAPTPEKLTKVLNLSLRQVVRLEELVDDLLDVAKIRNGKLHLHIEEVHLASLVQEVVDRFEGQLNESKSEVSLNLDESLSGFWDRSRIDQVAVNLISNAIKYAPGKKIEITVGKENDLACLSVKDHGQGIPSEKLGLVFERFERLTASRNISGLGLGLFIVKRIVEEHHGTIQVESEVGKGSRFVVKLPLSPISVSVPIALPVIVDQEPITTDNF